VREEKNGNFHPFWIFNDNYSRIHTASNFIRISCRFFLYFSCCVIQTSSILADALSPRPCLQLLALMKYKTGQHSQALPLCQGIPCSVQRQILPHQHEMIPPNELLCCKQIQVMNMFFSKEGKLGGFCFLF